MQENWKVSRRLTFDLGARFGWSEPFHSFRRQEAGFVPDRWNPNSTIQLMTPCASPMRASAEPSHGRSLPITVIGAIVPGSGDPYNGTVNLLTDSSYPAGLRNNSASRRRQGSGSLTIRSATERRRSARIRNVLRNP